GRERRGGGGVFERAGGAQCVHGPGGGAGPAEVEGGERPAPAVALAGEGRGLLPAAVAAEPVDPDHRKVGVGCGGVVIPDQFPAGGGRNVNGVGVCVWIGHRGLGKKVSEVVGGGGAFIPLPDPPEIGPPSAAF